MTNIFSTYSTGENRVTATFLAVLRCLSLDRMTKLLGNLLEDLDFVLITFKNQLSGGSAGVPDAVIQSSIRLLLETKTERDAVNLPQIERHLERLDASPEETKLLLVLTPDAARPVILDQLSDERVAWASFAMLDQAIDEMLGDKYEVVSEREAFLLRELQRMLERENLLANENDVVVVAARNAWPTYNELHAYTCQPNRSFQQVTRLGFYSKGVIYPLVPKILKSYDALEIRRDAYDGELGALVNRIIEKDAWPEEGTMCKVLLLSAPDSPDTLVLQKPISNDKRSKSGKPTAFTMGQRYVSSEALKEAVTTSDLD